MVAKRFGLYGILTDPKIGYVELAKIMAEKKLPFIQLRIKNESSEQILKIAKDVRQVIGPDSYFIVNDDPMIALQSDADGVHLGQGDMDYEKARSLMGRGKIIGLSTHNPTQTKNACELEPDYIGVGPVYATPTKKIPDPALGPKKMAQMLASATVPAVVLGGIDHENINTVLGAGAQNICAVRCICQASDPALEIDKLLSAIDEASR